MDQESSKTCAAHFSWYSEEHKISADFVWDSAHGAWNDVRLLSKDVSWFPWLLGLLLIWNLPHGPWQDDVRSSQVLQMLEDIAGDESTEPPPLLMSRMHDIARETGRSDIIGDEDAARKIWDDFRYNNLAFRKKGSKAQRTQCQSQNKSR